MLTATSSPYRMGRGEVTFDAKFGSDLFMPDIASAVIEFMFLFGLQRSLFSSLSIVSAVSAAFFSSTMVSRRSRLLRSDRMFKASLLFERPGRQFSVGRTGGAGSQRRSFLKGKLSADARPRVTACNVLT